jgi:3-oxoacyl-[acyl-carrier-protein] synthase-3
MIQDMLAAPRAAAFDLAAGCTGFVYALATAHQFIAAGTYDNVLVIGAEIISRFVDWEDRTTCVLFGDGAGAVVLQASDAPTGVLSFVLGSDGSEYDALIMPGGGSRLPFCQEVLDKGMHHIKMDGRRVFKFATKTPAEAAVRAIEGSGLSVEDIALLIPHQANLRIIQSLAKFLGMPLEKVYINLDKYGNTSAASIPIALCEALEEGRVKEGDNIVLLGFGAGLTWAAAVIKIGVPEMLAWPIPWQLVSLKDRSFSSVRSLAKGAVGILSAIVGALFLPFYSSADKGD